MEKLILMYVRSIGVFAVLRSKIVRGPLNLYQVDFFGTDDKYHSFLVPFNATRIFSMNKSNRLIGACSNEAIGSLENNHRVFDTREEWISGRFEEVTDNLLENYCKLLHPIVSPFEYNDFYLNRIEVTFGPIFAFIVDYSYKGILQKKLILVADQLTDCSDLYKDDHADFLTFLSKAGLLNYVTSNTRNMEVFGE